MTMRTRIMMLGGLLLALVSTAGCGGGAKFAARSTFVEFDATQKRVIAAESQRAYRLQEGDILRIAFPYESNLTQEGVVILADGAVSLVGVDRIVLAGRTVAEADSIVTAAYAKEYVEPDLSVIVVETPGRRVYVLGEVRSPGMFKVAQGGVGIVGAITMAGGFTEDADQSGTVLVRVTPEGYLVQEIDLDDLGSPGNAAMALIRLEPYDIVYVPQSRSGDFSYFARSVLQGLMSITRMAADIKYLSGGTLGRY